MDAAGNALEDVEGLEQVGWYRVLVLRMLLANHRARFAVVVVVVVRMGGATPVCGCVVDVALFAGLSVGTDKHPFTHLPCLRILGPSQWSTRRRGSMGLHQEWEGVMVVAATRVHTDGQRAPQRHI